MKNIYIKDIIDKLVKFKNTLCTIDKRALKKEIDEIDLIVKTMDKYKEVNMENLKNIKSFKVDEKSNNVNKNKKTCFSEAVKLLFNENTTKIKGIKLKYDELKNDIDIIKYFDSRKKEDILKETTLLDLKLLYCIITNDKNEVKGKKDEIFEKIINNIRALKRGEAFNKLI